MLARRPRVLCGSGQLRGRGYPTVLLRGAGRWVGLGGIRKARWGLSQGRLCGQVSHKPLSGQDLFCLGVVGDGYGGDRDGYGGDRPLTEVFWARTAKLWIPHLDCVLPLVWGGHVKGRACARDRREQWGVGQTGGHTLSRGGGHC